MIRIGSLCTGYGGIDMAVQAVLGGETAWVCDNDAAASTLLAHNHPQMPNHGDLTATDWAQVEPVDVMTGGWPCQPWSQAGKRKGADDERAIWPAVAAAIRTVRPRLVVLENVSAIAGAGELARACGDLAEAGYVGSWGCLRASDVGAPHRRERVFIAAADTTNFGQQRIGPAWKWRSGDPDRHFHALADPAGEGRVEPRDVGQDGSPAAPRAGQAKLGRRGSAAPDTEGQGLEGVRPEPPRSGPQRGDSLAPYAAGDGWGEGWPQPAGFIRGSDVAIGGDAASDSDGDGCESRPERHGEPQQSGQQASLGADPDGRVLDWAGYGPAIRRWETILGRSAPAPTVLGKRGGRQLAAPFVEWLMGLPEGWVCDVPALSRNQQLKLLGNGVVPLQCEAALRLLLPRLVQLEGVAA